MTDEWRATPVLRRAHRVLEMVGELHRRGHQRLRISPGLSPSGVHWRCTVLPRRATRSDNGALAQGGQDDLRALYTTGQDNAYFGWTDARRARARDLADLFLERFPDLAEAGRGQDWTYAGWYVMVLGHADHGHFPLAYADRDLPADVLTTTGPPGQTLPLPPPGEWPPPT